VEKEYEVKLTERELDLILRGLELREFAGLRASDVEVLKSLVGRLVLLRDA